MTAEQLIDARKLLQRIQDDVYNSICNKPSLRVAKNEKHEMCLRNWIQVHLTCGTGICPNIYSHPTDCSQVVYNHIYVYGLKFTKKLATETWLPGVGQLAVYELCGKDGKWIHKLGIHQFDDDKYRIIQSFRNAFDVFTTVTHSPLHYYGSATQQDHAVFYEHQKRYGLPYMKDGYSIIDEVRLFCKDMNACLSEENWATSRLVFGANVNAIKINTFVYAVPDAE